MNKGKRNDPLHCVGTCVGIAVTLVAKLNKKERFYSISHEVTDEMLYISRDVWDTRIQPKNEDEIEIGASGSITPSDSSSEDEKEVVKPHQRSGVALPGLGDALKIQMTRSELKVMLVNLSGGF